MLILQAADTKPVVLVGGVSQVNGAKIVVQAHAERERRIDLRRTQKACVG